jgi:hypothetical protein
LLNEAEVIDGALNAVDDFLRGDPRPPNLFDYRLLVRQEADTTVVELCRAHLGVALLERVAGHPQPRRREDEIVCTVTESARRIPRCRRAVGDIQ